MQQVATATSTRPRMMRGIRLSLSLAAGLLFGLLLGGAIVVLLATRLFGFAVVTITSDSMSPAIRSSDIVVVRPAAIDDISAGEIVLFTQGGDRVPTLHRVVGINEVETRVTSRSTGEETVLLDYRLVTQGDANPAPDASSVSRDELRGELWFRIPAAGWLQGMPVQGLMFLVAGVFGLGWCASWWRGRRRAQG
ncbi:MAG: signal peptidase I [Dehalococcoidia bacterium]